jgi:hypothetical protein
VKISKSTLPVFALTFACASAPAEDPEPVAPEPIGAELLRVEGGWGPASKDCHRMHLYRSARAIQFQCFANDGRFSWENRGTLTAEAAESLDAAIAGADLGATDPVNYKGGCGTRDSAGITHTLWIDEHELSFAPSCLIEGIVEVYAQVEAIYFEIVGCQGPFEELESVEPGCRWWSDDP